MSVLGRVAIHGCAAMILTGLASARARCFEPLDYQIKVETVFTHDDGKFLWYHPRAAALPGATPNGPTAVIMTLVKFLDVSDYYSGTYVMRTDNLGRTWSNPNAPPQLAWRKESENVVVSVCDGTPGWHAKTGKLLLVGAQVRYGVNGQQLEDRFRSNQTAYAVYDPNPDRWSEWKAIEMPTDKQFDYARSACAQWIVQEDGTILLPFYFGENANVAHSVTVAECRFDGSELKYVRHGNVLAMPEGTGLCEPSLVRYGTRYYLTIRHDQRAYWATSADGLHFDPIQPWCFDDGPELGSYNTQQHWLTHSDGLFLIYTRRDAKNDHIFRHRAPLFIAQIDPELCRVIRSTEHELIPAHGVEMGNFGASTIDRDQSWVTVSEGLANDEARRNGATGATFVARILWSKPNRLVTATAAGQILP